MSDYSNHPAIGEMLLAERKGVSFIECLKECAGHKNFVEQFDRLTGCNLSLKGTAFEIEIDKATGRVEKDLEAFAHFCWEYVFLTY